MVRFCYLFCGNAVFIVADRYHTVQEFNKGVYDYIIATDESGAQGEQDSDDDTDD